VRGQIAAVKPAPASRPHFSSSNWFGLLRLRCRSFFVVILGGHLSGQVLSCPQKHHEFGNKSRCLEILKDPASSNPSNNSLHPERMVLTNKAPSHSLNTRRTDYSDLTMNSATPATNAGAVWRTRSLHLVADGVAGGCEIL